MRSAVTIVSFFVKYDKKVFTCIFSCVINYDIIYLLTKLMRKKFRQLIWNIFGLVAVKQYGLKHACILKVCI